MSQLYARVFVRILDSSIAEDWQTRHVFEDILKLAEDGVLDVTRESFARRTNIPLDVVNAAINRLESPDPASRDSDDQGRRLVRLDDHRDWGWRITNWSKYEAIRNGQDQRERTRERVRRHREAKKAPPAPLKETTPTPAPEAVLLKRYRPLHSVTRPAGAGPASDEQWLSSFETDPAYHGIEIRREYAKMTRWCTANHRQPTRRRFVNWLNRCDRPMTAAAGSPPTKPLPDNLKF
jgi:hypothetical protein